MLFREVNERIRDVNESFGMLTGKYDVLCECEDVECTRRLEVPRNVYERVRIETGHYVLMPPHHNPVKERVVAGEASYLVVALDPVAAEGPASAAAGP